MTDLPTKAHLNNPGTTEVQFQSAIGQLYDYIAQLSSAGAFQEVTISSGVITPTSTLITLEAENGDPTDTLTNITAINVGSKLIFINALQTITLKHNNAGSGKLSLLGAVDVTLDNTGCVVALFYDSTLDKWVEIFRNFGVYAPTASVKAQVMGALGLGSAALYSVGSFATSAQGAKADTALQPGEGVVTLNRVVYSTSGTYSKPGNLIAVEVEALGGGGNAGNIPAYTPGAASGGGAGGYCKKLIQATSLATTETVTVGWINGTSSFGSHCTATGGSNGSYAGIPPSNSTSYVAGGAGGTASGGDINIGGQPGHSAGANPNSLGASGIFGAASGGNGGDSMLGFGGVGAFLTWASSISASGTVDGGAAKGAGAGGGGGLINHGHSNIARTGGAGTPGIIIITEYLRG